MDPYVRRGLVSANVEISSTDSKIELKKSTPEPTFSFSTTLKTNPVSDQSTASSNLTTITHNSATTIKSAFPVFYLFYLFFYQY